MPATAKSPVFDARSFIKYMKNAGRAYRNRAMTLISICQAFIQAQEQAFRSYDELRSVSQAVDDALKFAADAQNKKSKEADEKFEMAIDALDGYGKKWHPNENVALTVTKKMEEAKASDKSSSTILNKLKEKFVKKPSVEVPKRTVEFLIHKTLPDRNPTIVKMVLSKHASLPEVLWNFSRFKGEKRLTLEQNPHFYEVLPTSPEKYGDKFTMDPIKTFQHQKISVLTDNPGLGRVFLETAKEKRVFGNAWVPKDVIISKDLHGRLEGESIVGATLQDKANLRFEEFPLGSSHASPPAISRDRSGTSPITSVTTMIQVDWKVQIRRMSQPLDDHIRIKAT